MGLPGWWKWEWSGDDFAFVACNHRIVASVKRGTTRSSCGLWSVAITCPEAAIAPTYRTGEEAMRACERVYTALMSTREGE